MRVCLCPLYMLSRLEWWDRPRSVLLGLPGSMLIPDLTGDKSHHTLSLNIPQLFYFYGFASGLGWPILFFGGKGTTRGPIGLVRTFYYHASSTTR